MRVLSDFDGVLTDIAHEAARVTNLFLDALREASGGADRSVAELAHSAYEEMAAYPTLHGWRIGGRITAFANEDAFIRVNGLAACLDDRAARGDAIAKPLLAALQKGGVPAFTALAHRAYEMMTRETAAGAIKPLDPAAAEVLRALLARGDEVVVVSNSGTERIAAILKDAGLEPRPDGASGPGRLRIRGGARKFILGPEPRGFDVAGYAVSTDRPHYEEILLAERPDVVVGDVFSLDLALPLDLVRRGAPGFGRPRLALRRRPYTPAWSAGYVSGAARNDARCDVIDGMEEIL
jgi:FMN phosphatase YigB (HAD superfamily)